MKMMSVSANSAAYINFKGFETAYIITFSFPFVPPLNFITVYLSSMTTTAQDIHTRDRFSVDLDISKVDEKELAPYLELQRAANYLAGAMIFLKDNVMLREPLERKHIKPRLLGHWGTCPGINLVYAHCTRLVKKWNLDMLFVTGPGHGAPANLANLYLEQSITKYYPKYSMDERGLHQLVRGFSWPSGFPSHTNSEVPGQIHEGECVFSDKSTMA